MGTQSESPAGYGFSGRLNWLVSGAIGGVVGALLFGGLLWVIDPAIVTETIPAIYGFDPARSISWAFHTFHGLVLGIVFGYLVTRESILGALTADTQIGVLRGTGPAVRLVLAGIVYGFVVWALLPVFVLTVVAPVGGMVDLGFSGIALEILVGHLIYGSLLGALFSVFVDISTESETNDASLEETS